MVTNRIIFIATTLQPNPDEVDYWIDLNENPYGGCIKYFNGTEWIELSATSGLPDLSNYYTQQQVNNLLNTKASISEVQNKVDKDEAKNLINGVEFNVSMPNDPTLVVFKYDGSSKVITLPIASSSTAGIVTSQDFLDFVKQHQLQELHTEMIDLLADIRAKYQKRLIAGKNILIDPETNVISATGDIAVNWEDIQFKPDFHKVATSGDYNDLNNKLTAGKDVVISKDNVISIEIDSDELSDALQTIKDNINALNTDLAAEIKRSTDKDTEHTTAIATEVQDRKDAITTEVADRDAAIKVETDRATTAEAALGVRIDNHEAETTAALDLKADKSDTYTKAQVDAKVSSVYKVKGSVEFANLPTDNVVGDVYNVTDDFTLNDKPYDAGTNVVWTETGWDALSGSFDTSAIEDSITKVASDLAQEITDRTTSDNALDTRLTTAEGKLDIIQGDATTAGSINKALADAKLYADDKVRRGTVNSNVASEVLVDESENVEIQLYTKEQVDAKIDALTTNTNSEVSDIKDDLTALTNKVNTNTTNIANNDSDIADIISDATALEARVSTNETDIQTNKSDIATNAADIATNKVNIKNNSDAIASLTTKVSTNETNIDALQTSSTTNTTNISNLTTRVSDAENSITDLETKVSENTSNITGLGTRLTTAENGVNNKIKVGTETDSKTSDILVDTETSVDVEVYTKAEVDSIIAKLKADNNLN